MPLGVSPSLSRYFLGQRQFPSLGGILELATKKIHYSLFDTNKYEVSSCTFKPILMFICTAYDFHMIIHAWNHGSQAYSFIVSPLNQTPS